MTEEQQEGHVEKVVLAGVFPKDGPLDGDNGLDELRGLVKTAGLEVVGELVQLRDRPHAATCLGSGKVDELKRLAEDTAADLVVFDNNLSPSQGKNLEDAVKTVIVDRSELILDIFATHARTYEAKLQVELAQLLYTRTRLKRMWTHLERIEGGIGASRGPGEKQIETDRRLIDRRVAELRIRLKQIEKRRERTVSNRTEQTTVSLVGYTNAGKSTLMNALTEADVYVADKLFATLDTRTRRWKVPAWGTVLLSDTVGFVRDLPHHLVASFRSTLEEARQADLLLHIVDGSNPEAEEHLKTVNQVLSEIGIDASEALLVFNKCDLVEDRSRLDVLRAAHPDSYSVSAATGAGLDRLTEVVADRLAGEFLRLEIETSAGNGRVRTFLKEHAEILDTRYHDDRVTVDCRLAKTFADRLRREEVTIRVSDPRSSDADHDGTGHDGNGSASDGKMVSEEFPASNG